ncbi:MAG: helix-turn-helix transcriptional regulator [Bacteroidales bacterium]|nr:helix-turn-helix transcriptional regulator [Bacteroidales bacterium]
MENNDILSRVQYLIKIKNITASNFADEIGVQRSSISHLLSGRNKPSLEFIQKIISRYPEIQTDWLIFGKGNMYKEQTLFDQPAIKIEKDKTEDIPINEINKPSQQIPVEIASPSDAPAETHQINIPSVQTQNPINQIQKIIILYSDNTFQEYIKH